VDVARCTAREAIHADLISVLSEQSDPPTACSGFRGSGRDWQVFSDVSQSQCFSCLEKGEWHVWIGFSTDGRTCAKYNNE